MTGISFRRSGTIRMSLVLAAALGLAACDENGEFAFPSGDDAAASGTTTSAAPLQTTTTEQDVERPDLFEVTDRGLWDGRPSLGGAWVAHPDVVDPERALIRNTATGETVVGALFRRERENPGPLLQVSSDVAEALGILPGAPTELYVVALRREEITVEDDVPENNPVVASLATPVNVEATPLDPVAGAAAAIDAAEEAAAPAIDVVLPAAAATAAAATEAASTATPEAENTAEAAPVAPAAMEGPMIQIGVFSVEDNANQAAQRLRDAGVPTTVIAQEAGGRTVWRVASGSSDDTAERDDILAKIKDLGYVDAFVVEG
ncbi:SPOR domain-containing protein [Yoonia sp. R2-816]|uniref:SPOR domain-containing protein n=1 Tax=Yoonia sp. R2-816 TaxID=3342638 RepID=UPI003728FE7F